MGPDVDGVLFPDWSARRSDLRDPDPEREAHRAALRGASALLTRSARAEHRYDERAAAEPEFEGEREESFSKRRAPADKPPSRGANPDDGEPAGRPDAERPDPMAALPTTGQPHYFSPAPLKRDAGSFRPADALRRSGAAGPKDASADLPSSRAGFAPARTAPLDDEVPQTGVDDPKALGSYRVQICATRDFRKPFYDKTYPFMADIDIVSDLRAVGARRGEFWIRWSLIDLLEFEHPFTRPQRLVLEDPRAP